jgi:Putative phage metallopeptidase
MPTFKKCDNTVHKMAEAILSQFPSHKPLIEARDEDSGEPLNNALTKNGIKCLGLTRALPLKERVMGRGDAEVCLDGDWWTDATEGQQKALLDHELHHIALKMKKQVLQCDDLGRPLIKLSKHDVEVGWFAVIADRHGADSQEQIQAKAIMEATGQYFWLDLVPDAAKTIKRIK